MSDKGKTYTLSLKSGAGCAMMILALCLGVGSCSFLSHWRPDSCRPPVASPAR